MIGNLILQGAACILGPTLQVQNRHVRHSYKSFSVTCNYAEPRLTQEMERHVAIVYLATDHSDSDIATFLKVAWSLVFKIRRELEAYREATWGDVARISHWKWHCRISDIIRSQNSLSAPKLLPPRVHRLTKSSSYVWSWGPSLQVVRDEERTVLVRENQEKTPDQSQSPPDQT